MYGKKAHSSTVVKTITFRIYVILCCVADHRIAFVVYIIYSADHRIAFVVYIVVDSIYSLGQISFIHRFLLTFIHFFLPSFLPVIDPLDVDSDTAASTIGVDGETDMSDFQISILELILGKLVFRIGRHASS